jgi:3',5'-cyclic-AMP phosphodiesterase
MRIGHFSDIHVLDPRFDEGLLETTIDEINAEDPDLVVVAGDLTSNGYREQFEYARSRLDRLACREIVLVPGNHDARSVGYLHYEDLFGERAHARTIDAPDGRVQIVCVDSSKPDIDDGEIGRELYGWILDSFAGEAALRIFVMHHHLVAIPGTGRDRNQVWDAGDALEILRSAEVDIVLGGHRHVPHVWPIGGLFLVHSGTASTRRVRGYSHPSYNFVTLTRDLIEVEMREPGGPREVIARFERPSGPDGDYRSMSEQVVRRQRGGSFRSES